MDAGQPDSNCSNPMLTLFLTRNQEDIGSPSDETKQGQGKPSVNVTTNPLDVSLIGTRASIERSSDGPGRTGNGKSRGKAAGESRRSKLGPFTDIRLHIPSLHTFVNGVSESLKRDRGM